MVTLGRPDPFAVLSIDDRVCCTTTRVVSSLNPVWEAAFDLSVMCHLCLHASLVVEALSCHGVTWWWGCLVVFSTLTTRSMISVQVFDERHFSRKQDQGFLGVVNILVSSVLDLQKPVLQLHKKFDLKKSNSKEMVKGAIVL